jgi:YidC/Oxa1 family membrane protein insertase
MYFFALRGMARAPAVGFDVGGVAWFSNLCVPDPYMVLPAITALTALVSIKVHG